MYEQRDLDRMDENTDKYRVSIKKKKLVVDILYILYLKNKYVYLKNAF